MFDKALPQLPQLPDDPGIPNGTVAAPEEETFVWSPVEQDATVTDLPDEGPISTEDQLSLDSDGYRAPAGLKTLRPRQRRVVRMAFSGVPYGKIAQRMGYSRWAVSQIMHSLEGKHYLEHLYARGDTELLRQDVQLMLQQNSVAAVNALVEPLHDPKADKKLRQSAAVAVLEYAGHKPKAQAEVTVTSALTKDDLLGLSGINTQLTTLEDKHRGLNEVREAEVSPGS